MLGTIIGVSLGCETALCSAWLHHRFNVVALRAGGTIHRLFGVCAGRRSGRARSGAGSIDATKETGEEEKS